MPLKVNKIILNVVVKKEKVVIKEKDKLVNSEGFWNNLKIIQGNIKMPSSC